MFASLGPAWSLHPNGATPRCLTVNCLSDVSSKSVVVDNIHIPFDSNRHNNPFDDNEDDDVNDVDDGGGQRGGYVYSVAFGTDCGSLHFRNYPPSTSSRFDSGGSGCVRGISSNSSSRGGHPRIEAKADPSRLTIEPLESDSIDLRGAVKGSIACIIRGSTTEQDHHHHDSAPVFLLLVDDNEKRGVIGGGGSGGGGGLDASKDVGAYAAHLVMARNGTFQKIDNFIATTTMTDDEPPNATVVVSSKLTAPLSRMSCAAYHPDAGYVYAAGTSVYGLSTTGTTAVSSSSPPTVLYLGCARSLPSPGARTSSAGGHQDMTLCCTGRVAIVAVANAFYAVPGCLDLTRLGGVTNAAQFPNVTATRIASFAQSSQVHPVIVVEILSYVVTTKSPCAKKMPRPISSLLFLASGRECSTVKITSVPTTAGEGIVPTTIQLTLRSQKHGAYAATLPSPILAAASIPPTCENTRGKSGGGDLSSGSLIVLLTVDGLVHFRSPLCIAVALATVEVGTRPNDFFTLLPLSAPPSGRWGGATVGRRTVVATSYGGESRLITVDDRESTQDFADRLMRLCIDAFGPNGFPRRELAEVSGATFSATSYTGSGVGGGGGEQASSSLTTLAHSNHKRALLKQYLECVLGLADDAQARAPFPPTLSPQRTAGDIVSLQLSDGVEVETVNLHSMDEQGEESNDDVTISPLGANSLLTCTTLLCLACYQLSSPDGVAAVRASKACASVMGISSSLTFSKAAVAVCELVADRLLKEVTSTSMASFSLLTTSSPAPIVSSYCSSNNSTMEFIESSVWLLRSCGCHEKAINVLQDRMNSPAFRNSVGGGGNVREHRGSTSNAGVAGGWSQIKFDSYITTHLGELWSSNDDQYRRIVLLSSATRDLLVREPSLGLSVFTTMNPRNAKEWTQMKPEDDPLGHPYYPSKVVELLRSIFPQQTSVAVGGGGLSDEHRQLTSSFSDGSPKASSPLPMNSGRALAVSFLESAIGIATGRPSPGSSSQLESSSNKVDERYADMHDELYYLLLEGVVSEGGDEDKVGDSKLCAIYRFKLRRLLSWPNSKIRSDKLLTSLPPPFLRERALLLGRLGRHEDALRILYSQEDCLDLALEYCDIRHERHLAQMTEVNRNVGGGEQSSKALPDECPYIPLIRVALFTDLDLERGITAAIQVLALRRGVIDKAAALRLLPKHLPMSSIARPFMIPAVIESEAEVRRLTIASALLRSRYIQLKQKLTEAQLKSQASLHSIPALQRLNLSEPLHSSKLSKARPVHAPSPYYPDVTLIKHFFPQHLVIQVRVANGATAPNTQNDDNRNTLTNVAFVVAESSDDALVPTMEIPLRTLPPGAIGCAWCVLSASPQRLDGAAFLTCELRYTVLEVDASMGIPTNFSEGTKPSLGFGRTYVEELHDIEVRRTEFG